MTGLQKGIVTLIRSALTGDAFPLPEGFQVSEAYPVIMKHQIVTLAYEGAVKCGISKAEPEMQKLFQNYCRCLLQSERQLRVIENIYAAFDANGIDYMPLKGCNLKSLYPKPELRLMGDADILIRTEQHAACQPLLKKLGFAFQEESDHEYIWTSSALFLELHKRLIPSYNKDYHRYFGNGWKLAKLQKRSRYQFSCEDEFIYIFCHFAKHYRDGGIGCRHVTDLWVYLQSHPHMDMEYLTAELEKLQLLKFYQNMQKLLSVWFEDIPSNEKVDFITEYIFASGVWGNLDNHAKAAAVRASKASGSAKSAKSWQLLRMMFLPYNSMCKRYPVLKKCPILLPFLWPVRWMTALLFRRTNIHAQQHQLKMSASDKIESYQAALNYVGLDFNFKE